MITDAMRSRFVDTEWRPLNYVCRTCGDVARAHPETNEIWGCLNCGMTTMDIAMSFAEFGYPEAARSIAVQLSEFCNEDEPYPQMIASAARDAAKRIEMQEVQLEMLAQIATAWMRRFNETKPPEAIGVIVPTVADLVAQMVDATTPPDDLTATPAADTQAQHVRNESRMDKGLIPIEKPLDIDAIECRVRQDITHFGVTHSIPTNELRLILDIVEAARECVRQWQPNQIEKQRGAGTGVGMRAAEDRLIRVVKRERI